MDASPPDIGTEKNVVLIGTPADDGVAVKIHSLGYRYIRRVLASGPSNWLSIANQLRDLRNAELLAGVVLLLTENSIDLCLLPEHSRACKSILAALSGTPALAFVYEVTFEQISTVSPQIASEPFPLRTSSGQVLLRGHFPGPLFVESRLAPLAQGRTIRGKHPETLIKIDYDGGFLSTTEELFVEEKAEIERVLTERNELARDLFEDMRLVGVEIVPYRRRFDRVIRTERFLDATVRGEFLRLYVPSGRFQGDQLASFLRLFESYFRRIEGHALLIDTEKADHGTVYVFRSEDHDSTLAGMQDAVARFESLLQLYEYSP